MKKFIVEGFIENMIVDPALWIVSQHECDTEKEANEFGEQNMLPGFTVRKVEENDNLPF